MKQFNLSKMVWNELTNEETKTFKNWLETEFDNDAIICQQIAYSMIQDGYDLDEHLREGISEIIWELAEEDNYIDHDDDTRELILSSMFDHNRELIKKLRLDDEEYQDIANEMITDYLNEKGASNNE